MFQAEDSIRNDKRTGVQTCALPISRLQEAALLGEAEREYLVRRAEVAVLVEVDAAVGGHAELTEDRVVRRALHVQKRSEERRVGKECRSKRTQAHSNTKETRASARA